MSLNMMITIPLLVLMCGVIILGILIPFLFFVIPKVYERTHYSDFNEVFSVFASIVKSEINAYDTDIFENNRTLTNANFDNFYFHLSGRIVNRISPCLMRELKRYLTEEAIVSYVARTVKKYLTNRAIPDNLL